MRASRPRRGQERPRPPLATASATAAMLPDGRFTGIGVKGLTFPRRWTRPGVHPYDEIEWETRTAAIGNEKGVNVFEQKDVEVPAFWSQLATNVVVSKYFRGHLGTPERETSVRQLIDRVVNTITAWAETQHYFATDEDLRAFQAELTHLLVHQKLAFNSPVWFNVGVEEHPQCSACFINSVQDTMSSIMDLAKTEAMLFKFGSGAGSNLSHHSIEQGEDVGRRHRLRPGQLHARLRRLRRRGQVGRQDPPRRQDGDPRCHPPRHPGIHQLQAAGGEEGLGPDRGRLRPELHRRGLRFGRLPERQPLRPRDGRLHARGRGRRLLDHPRRRRRRPDGHLQGPRPLPRDGRSGLGLRRPRHPVRHHDQRLEPGRQFGPPARHQPVLASSASSTTPAATSRRST